jgi:hypothetical protein
MRPLGLCRSQNYEIRAGADDTESSRHILKVGIPSPTTGTRKEWAAPGATTIPTTFKPHTTGATMKKDRQEWMADGRSFHFPPTNQ